MDYPTFLDNDITESLYSGKFGGDSFASINELPWAIKYWIAQHFPGTTHVRLGPTCGLPQKMEWWIGGWTNPSPDDIYKPKWTYKIYSQWK